ncbi:chemotaxis protein CheB [Pararhizobium sp. LjRoot235]|uniref:chemotaxis protein CheB n=1 Tax=Pararhizobium sp. LjRoot235 TaxID=3342291 RepID=UPI003ECC1DD6
MVRILLATCRSDLQELIEKAALDDPDVKLVGTARSETEAVRLARELSPDIVVVELLLSGEDSAGTVKEIMISAPAPVIVVSCDNRAELGSLSGRALEAGALAVIPAPPLVDGRLQKTGTDKFLSTIKAMSQVKVVRQRRNRSGADKRADVPPVGRSASIGIVGITASTGGPAAIRSILKNVSAGFPAPILIVQHISSGFIEGVAVSLDATVPLKVKVAEDGERLKPGTVYLAPDGHQLGVSGRTRICVTDDAAGYSFKPSGSYLFSSIARAFKTESLAVVLTGMGDDGTEGLRSLRKAGGKVIAQDEMSSIIFGMPKAAIGADLVDFVLPLERIAGKIVALSGNGQGG